MRQLIIQDESSTKDGRLNLVCFITANGLQQLRSQSFGMGRCQPKCRLPKCRLPKCRLKDPRLVAAAFMRQVEAVVPQFGQLNHGVFSVRQFHCINNRLPERRVRVAIRPRASV